LFVVFHFCSCFVSPSSSFCFLLLLPSKCTHKPLFHVSYYGYWFVGWMEMEIMEQYNRECGWRKHLHCQVMWIPSSWCKIRRYSKCKPHSSHLMCTFLCLHVLCFILHVLEWWCFVGVFLFIMIDLNRNKNLEPKENVLRVYCAIMRGDDNHGLL
jgi:hypothetical protein